LGLLTLLALSMITFLLPYLGGVDPGEMILRAKTGGDLPASREALRVLRDQMDLDVPMHVLYLRWFSEALQGNLGYSYITLRPTVQVLAEAALTTLQLALGAMSLIVVIGVPAGTIAAVKRNSYVDRAISMLAILGVSVPVYFLAFLAIFCLGVYLSLFPVAGRGGLAHLVMPATLLAVPEIAMTVRLVRYSFLEVLQEDHITVARAKGVSERIIILKHAFKNVAPPIITYLGLQLG
jgi:peptide/nickel transport system permease protein